MAIGVSGTKSGYAISNLRAKLGAIARPNNFLVSLQTPSFTQGGAIRSDKPNQYDIAPTFEFRCEKAELPGRTVATTGAGAGAVTTGIINSVLAVMLPDFVQSIFINMRLAIVPVVNEAVTDPLAPIVNGFAV